MNKRILELAIAAAPANSSIPHSEWNIPKEFIEKFAELIVRECGEVAYKAYWANPETVRGRHIEVKIREHFGVE